MAEYPGHSQQISDGSTKFIECTEVAEVPDNPDEAVD